MKVRLRKRARRDLREIWDYSVVQHGEEVADAYLRDVDAALARLADYPELGTVRADLGADLRSLPVREHRIFYVIYPDRVSVFRVLHKAMDVQRHL
ncbi:MAG TPA: type II toxin-antitoxin system RelE/ParE family toxin [Allosphingosinicella sp.]